AASPLLFAGLFLYDHFGKRDKLPASRGLRFTGSSLPPAPLMKVNCSGKAQRGGLIRPWTALGSSACVCHRRLDQTPILTL
ncbi:hypothetical protein JTL89_33100, partial [Pseudomonas aeruginosa]|nr:hypothetical protein [Pseudomonas aeruginosa]